MTQLNRLSSAFIKSAPHGKHADGQGLWLVKRADGGSQWVLRISLAGKRREMGLGNARDVSLKEARELASDYRKHAKQGVDPIKLRQAEKRTLLKPGGSLTEIATAAYEAKRQNLKMMEQTLDGFSPLQLHVLPKLGKLSIEDITQQDIAEALQPIWHQKVATAKKAIGRLSIALTYAAAAGYDVDLNAIAKAKALLGKHRHQTQTSLP